MNLRLVLSGPSAASSQMANALAGAGYADVRPTHSHGHADGHLTRWTGEYDGEGDVVPETGTVEAIAPDHPVSWLEASGPDVDRAAEIAGQFGWVLRAHWSPDDIQEAIDPAETTMSVPARLARIESDLVIVKGLV